MQDVALQDEKAQKFLAQAIEKCKQVADGGKAFGMALSAIIFRDVMGHFEREEGPDGKWEPWSDMYDDHMQRSGKGGNKLLQDSGHLRNAFLPTNYRSASDGIVWFNPAKTKKGFPYAYHHDEGADKTRSFMWLSDEGSEKIAQVTLDFVLGKT